MAGSGCVSLDCGEARRVFRTIQPAAIGILLGMVLLFYAYPDALMSRLAVYTETAKLPVVGVESGYGTLVVEMGNVGLILWIAMSVAVLFSPWKVAKKLKGSPWFPLSFVIFSYSFFLLIVATYGGIAAYEDYLLNAYLWLLLSMLFRLPTIALSAQFAADTPLTQPVRRWIR
jgi:hypothetical protein